MAVLDTSAWECVSILCSTLSWFWFWMGLEWNFFVSGGQKISRNKGGFKPIGNPTDYVPNSTCFHVLNRVHDLYACARRSLSRRFYHAAVPPAFKPKVPRFWAGKTLRRKRAKMPKRFILRVPRLPFSMHSQYDGFVAWGSLAVLCRLRTVFDVRTCYITKRISRFGSRKQSTMYFA